MADLQDGRQLLIVTVPTYHTGTVGTYLPSTHLDIQDALDEGDGECPRLPGTGSAPRQQVLPLQQQRNGPFLRIGLFLYKFGSGF